MRYRTIVADPPWQFTNRTGKVGPEHGRLFRYETMSLSAIQALPIAGLADTPAHLYLWCPTALLPVGIETMRAWDFRYVTALYWHKVRVDGGSDGRGVGFYFRNVIEPCLFGVRGSLRTLPPGRRQVNLIGAQRRGHSEKPEHFMDIIEQVSPGPRVELFARRHRLGWDVWGNESANTAHLEIA